MFPESVASNEEIGNELKIMVAKKPMFLKIYLVIKNIYITI